MLTSCRVKLPDGNCRHSANLVLYLTRRYVPTGSYGDRGCWSHRRDVERERKKKKMRVRDGREIPGTYRVGLRRRVGTNIPLTTAALFWARIHLLIAFPCACRTPPNFIRFLLTPQPAISPSPLFSFSFSFSPSPLPFFLNSRPPSRPCPPIVRQ